MIDEKNRFNSVLDLVIDRTAQVWNLMEQETNSVRIRRYDATQFVGLVTPHLQQLLQAVLDRDFPCTVSVNPKFPEHIGHLYQPEITITINGILPRFITGDRFYQEGGYYYLDLRLGILTITLRLGSDADVVLPTSTLRPEGRITLNAETYDWTIQGQVITIANEQWYHRRTAVSETSPRLWKIGFYGFVPHVILHLSKELGWLRESIATTSGLFVLRDGIPFEIEGLDSGILMPHE